MQEKSLFIITHKALELKTGYVIINENWFLRPSVIGARVAPSTGRASWTLPLSLALLAEWNLTGGASRGPRLQVRVIDVFARSRRNR